MSRAQYFVLLQKEQWIVTVSGQDWGPFPTERDAIEQAVRGARTGGVEAEVLVECGNGQFRTKWPRSDEAGPPAP